MELVGAKQRRRESPKGSRKGDKRINYALHHKPVTMHTDAQRCRGARRGERLSPDFGV